MKYLSSNANTITIIQLFCLIATVAGFAVVEFTAFNIFLTVLFFYLYTTVGVSITLHRYYGHKSFKFRTEWLRRLCTMIAILSGRGSPLGWAYIHRVHHPTSDTQDDPHSPNTIGFRLFNFIPIEKNESKTKVFLIKDLMNTEQLFINKYYVGIIIAWLAFLALINPELVYFTYVVPVLLVILSQNSFNFIAHTRGYRNFDTEDQSTNNIFLWPLVWGEAWHNNHHANPNNADFGSGTSGKWWEFDPAISIIKLIGK